MSKDPSILLIKNISWSSITWGTAVTLWLLLGDLEATGRSSSSHDSRLLFELLVGWRTKQILVIGEQC